MTTRRPRFVFEDRRAKRESFPIDDSVTSDIEEGVSGINDSSTGGLEDLEGEIIGSEGTFRHSSQFPYSETETESLSSLDKVSLSHVRAMWVNRRRMAYISLITSLFLLAIVVGILIFGSENTVDNLTKMESFIISAFMTLIGLVGAYMGLATIADVKQDVFRLRKRN